VGLNVYTVDGSLRELQEYCYLILEVHGAGWMNGKAIYGALQEFPHPQAITKQTKQLSLDTWLLGF
jgi:hypothetical protein